MLHLNYTLDLEEALQPPNLEDTLTDENKHLEDGPPLNTLVCRLGSIAVNTLTENDIRLLILDLCQKLRKSTDFHLQWVCWCFRLWDVDNAVNVERDLLCVCGPLLIAEAVGVLSVVLCDERVIASRNAALVCLESSYRVTNPEINVEVACLLELSVSDLEGHSHSIILVELLVETFAAVCLKLDVMRDSACYHATEGEESGKTHFEAIRNECIKRLVFCCAAELKSLIIAGV